MLVRLLTLLIRAKSEASDPDSNRSSQLFDEVRAQELRNRLDIVQGEPDSLDEDVSNTTIERINNILWHIILTSTPHSS